MGEGLIAPGVYGWLFDMPNGIYIPVISATNPGSGDVGRFLDSLPKDRAIKFPTVMSPVLRGMLLRRGFLDVLEFAEELGGDVEVMMRAATGGGIR
jgi:hypothetical protein